MVNFYKVNLINKVKINLIIKMYLFNEALISVKIKKI